MENTKSQEEQGNESSITFNIDNSSAREEVIRIDSQGFHYKGKFIEDAGEAHRLLVEFLRLHTANESTKYAGQEDEFKQLCAEILQLLDYYIPEDDRATCWDPWRHRARAALEKSKQLD